MTNLILWVIIGYLSGSVLYSRLIAKYFLNTDITQVADGNPGMTNIARIGGTGWAALAFALDCSKGAAPVGLAHTWIGIDDWRLILIALAPAIGHALPIFFGFDGGKGIAAIAGGWIGVAGWQIITIGAVLLVFWYFSVEENAWATILMCLSVGVYLILTRAEALWFGFWIVGLIFLLWTHRHHLPNEPGVKPWVKRTAVIIWRH